MHYDQDLSLDDPSIDSIVESKGGWKCGKYLPRLMQRICTILWITSFGRISSCGASTTSFTTRKGTTVSDEAPEQEE